MGGGCTDIQHAADFQSFFFGNGFDPGQFIKTGAEGFIGNHMFAGFQGFNGNGTTLAVIVPDGNGIAGNFRQHFGDAVIIDGNVGPGGTAGGGIFFADCDDPAIGIFHRPVIQGINVTVTQTGDNKLLHNHVSPYLYFCK